VNTGPEPFLNSLKGSIAVVASFDCPQSI